jgi:hypothetical protein
MATKLKPNAAEGVLCAIKLPCCRCLDGTETLIPIDTGVAAWRVTPPGSAYQLAAVPIPPVPGAWTTLLGPPAVWIGAPGAPETVGDYEFELQFYVPDCVIPAEIVVKGEAAADNWADIWLDTNSTGINVPTYDNSGITSFVAGPVSGPGIHRLRFVLTNAGGPTGLVVKGTIVVRCPRQLEHGSGVTATGTGRPVDKA